MVYYFVVLHKHRKEKQMTEALKAIACGASVTVSLLAFVPWRVSQRKTNGLTSDGNI